MSTKVKGLFKGLKYISQIFEEEKEAEIQIGFPTDVKHVAHIGWDGPAAQDNPSWMKDFKGQSAPLDATTGLGSGDPNTNTEAPDIKWASEDKKSRRSRGIGTGGETPELPKSTRRQSPSSSAASDNPDSPKAATAAAAAASKPRQNRRHHSKDGSDVSKSSELGGGLTASESSAKDAPHLPKRTRRKKSKESDAIGTPSSCRKSSRAAPSHPAAAATTSAPDGEADNGDHCEEAPAKEDYGGK